MSFFYCYETFSYDHEWVNASKEEKTYVSKDVKGVQQLQVTTVVQVIFNYVS